MTANETVTIVWSADEIRIALHALTVAAASTTDTAELDAKIGVMNKLNDSYKMAKFNDVKIAEWQAGEPITVSRSNSTRSTMDTEDVLDDTSMKYYDEQPEIKYSEDDELQISGFHVERALISLLTEELAEMDTDEFGEDIVAFPFSEVFDGPSPEFGVVMVIPGSIEPGEPEGAEDDCTHEFQLTIRQVR